MSEFISDAMPEKRNVKIKIEIKKQYDKQNRKQAVYLFLEKTKEH